MALRVSTLDALVRLTPPSGYGTVHGLLYDPLPLLAQIQRLKPCLFISAQQPSPTVVKDLDPQCPPLAAL